MLIRAPRLLTWLGSSALAAALLAASTLHAQAPRSGGGGEAQKFMQQYQQISDEKAALQAQLEQSKKDLQSAQTELATVKKERDALKSRAGGSQAELAQLTAGKESAEKSLEQYKQKMTELVGRFREAAVNLRDVEADRTRLQNDLKDRTTALDKCSVDNLSLFEINKEILDRYEHVGLFTRVSSNEPFTRITRTRIDNLVEEYRERALQYRAAQKAAEAPQASAPSAPASPAAPAKP
jgi:chromosome segregation ATPase